MVVETNRMARLKCGGAFAQTEGRLDYQESVNIVLVEPEIPGNTGTIGRLCVGLNASLTLVGTLGFSLEDKYLRRAGLDYWPHLRWQHLPDLETLYQQVADSSRFYFFTTKSDRPYTHATYTPGDFLVFGKETKGLSPEILQRYQDRTYTIPMFGEIRSINLAISVGIVAYEATRQIHNGF